MRKVAMALLAGTLALGGAAGARADEGKHEHQSVTMAELPLAAQKTLQREAKGGKIEELEKEHKDGKVVYEAEIVKNGQETEIVVSADGKVLERGKPKKHD